jgi:hypothetical protein
MSINSTLRREGIEVIGPLNTLEINKIASTISEKLCTTFPEHNLDQSKLFASISRLNMYVAKFPGNDAVAKYFYKNNSIYFSNKLDLNDLNTLAIHECIHFIQELKNKNGKLLRLGLYNLEGYQATGMALNEAAVQFMASLASGSKSDTVRYYGMDFSTESTDYYPLETALIKEIAYFTGTYPLFHSTFFSNDVFKNTFIAKSSLRTYLEIEKNFDLLVNYETELANISYKISYCSDSKSNEKRLQSLLEKSNILKSNILKVTLETQNIILHDCFTQEFEHIRDLKDLKSFQSRIYNFKNLLINSEDYNYYNDFYRDMMNSLEEKREQIKKYGVLPYNDIVSQELALVDTKFYNLSFFKKLFEKLTLLFEERIRSKEM